MLNPNMLTVDLKKHLGSIYLDISFAIPLKGVTAIFGRSGAGKTSLINLLSGLIKPDFGYIALGEYIFFDSKIKLNVPVHKRQIGYVFQDARLFPHYSVLKNLTYGHKSNDIKKANEVIDLLGIGSLLSRNINNLSGGEKQRVAIGRALLTEPKMLLMDEPLSSLDIMRKNELLMYLDKLSKEIDIPIIFVTHGIDEILHLANNMVIIDNGKLVLAGDVDNVWNSNIMSHLLPAKEHSSLLKAKVVGKHSIYPLVKLELSEDITIWAESKNQTICNLSNIEENLHKFVQLRVYANDITISKNKSIQSSINNEIPATIKKIEYSIDKNIVKIELCTCFKYCNNNNTDKYIKTDNQVCNQVLQANLKPILADELQLKAGDKVYAQLKTFCIYKLY